MAERDPQVYRSLAEAAWAWVQAQVRWDDGPWIPESVPAAADATPAGDRDGLHSGIAGLAHVLAEVRLARPWSTDEERLAAAIGERIRRALGEQRDATFFDGLTSAIGALTALGGDQVGGDQVGGGADQAVARLTALAEPDGWPQQLVGPPRYAPGARVHDLTLGTAGVLLGAVWARRAGIAGATELAEHAAGVLVADAQPTADGLNWPWVPDRCRVGEPFEMPNLSHGLAGIGAALAVAGTELARPDLVAAARAGAEHLVGLADRSGGGFVVQRSLPHTNPDMDLVTYTWCHGPTGTSLLFAALDRAGVEEVAGAAPDDWYRRCLHSVRVSGVPQRLYPGFWDNDGLCCGTAGVGEVFLHSWQRRGTAEDLEFALELADVLVARAVREGPFAYWRFVEHRNTDPLLPPGVGWMQGATGIAAHLFRVARVVQDPHGAAALPRMDTWWALP